MKIQKISQDKWAIYACADDDETCPVIEFLTEMHDQKNARKMLALLKERAPIIGLIFNENISKQLRDDIYEYKVGHKKGTKLRVLYFTDAGRIIVCTSAFEKTSKTREDLIDEAVELKNQYIRDKENNNIQIIE